MEKKIEYYADAWYKVEFDIKESSIEFKAWKIIALDEDDLPLSDIDEKISIHGYIKWDGCMEFTQEEHYCDFLFAEQTLLLMKYIYKLQESIWNYCD